MAAGTVVAGFRIESSIGHGAMGAVYLAEETGTGRRVALKMLADELAGDDRFRQRFLRESQLAASLNHPHIVTTLGSGEQDGVLYLAMAHVEGSDLRAILQREQQLEPDRALGLLADVAGALDHAHAAGLVHRDVKPGNILVAREGDEESAYVCDFGLARHASSASSLTGSRGFLGTIDYVSPEQIAGGAIDGRTDVYSLGCVLFECLAGRRPFERDSELAVVFAHLNEPPPSLSRLRAGLPEALEDVFRTALAKSPEHRFRSCGELVAAAHAALHGRRRLSRRRRRLALLAAATVAASAAAAGLLLTREPARAFPPETVLLDLASGRRLASVPRSTLPSPAFPTYAGGRFWVVTFDPSAFVAVAPRSGRIVRRIPAPPGFLTDHKESYQPYAVAAGTLWLGSGDDLLEVDADSGRVVDRLSLDRLTGVRAPAEGVTVGMGLVWVSRDAGAGQVIGIDPATRRVRYRFDDVVHHDDIAYGAGLVWTADFAGASVLDPRAGTVAEAVDVPHTSRFVAAGGGYGWTADPAKGVVYKLDRNARVADSFRTGLGADGVAFTDGVLWVANDDEGTVTGIDAITGKQRSYRLGHQVAVQAAGGGVLLAALQPGASVEDRVAALEGEVVRLFSKQGAFGEGDEPALNANPAAFQIELATCAKLLNHPDEGGAAGLRLRPEIAAAMPTVSRDGRTYTFRVRRGFRFSPPGNERVTAETFRYSIERALSPRLGTLQPGAAYVDDIVGERAFRAGGAAHISGLHARGDRLAITLTRPSPDFLQRLALPFFCPVPVGTPVVRNGLARGGDPLAGGGTVPAAGPYYLASFSNDKSLILRRNPNYRGPRPHAVDTIALRESVDTGVALDRIEHAGWDGIVSSSHNAPGSPFFDPLLDPRGPVASRYGAGTGARPAYVTARLPATSFLALNSSRGAFADPAVRRAAALALDRANVAATAGDAPTDQLLPPMFPAFRERTLFPPRPRPGAAARLLRGRHPALVMAVAGGCEPCLRVARPVRSGLARAGFRVRLRAYANPLAAADARRAAIDLLAIETHLDYPDSASFLERALLEDAPRGWIAPSLRRDVERVAGLAGALRQSAAAALADRLVRSRVAVIPWGNPIQPEVFSPRLGCRVFPPTGYGVDLAALCTGEPTA